MSRARFGCCTPGHDGFAQDHMRRQVAHHDQRLRLVEMVDLRHAAGVAGGMAGQRVVFEEGPAQGQRPALADHAQIGQGLLDDQRARWAR